MSEFVYNNFSGGEISPRMMGRFDLPIYYAGAKQIQNMVVLPTGGLVKAPGTDYIADQASANYSSRLQPFIYARTQAYILEFGHQTMRVFKDDGTQVMSGLSPYALVTPYSYDDLFDLVFVPSWNELWIYHPDYKTRVLTRTAHDAWTITAAGFTNGPFLPENTGTTTITPSATTGNINLVASAAIFDTLHIGSLWQITHPVSEIEISGTAEDLAGTAYDGNMTRKGTWDFTVSGTWYGTFKIQKKYTGASTYTDVRVYKRATTKSSIVENDNGKEEEDGVTYRLAMTDIVGSLKYTFRFNSSWQDGTVSITAVSDSTHAVGTVVNTLGGTDATQYWSEAAWSDYRGWPSAGCSFEQRAWFGSTYYLPNHVWAGKSFAALGTFTNMQIGDDDDDALSFAITTAEANGIQWMVPMEFMLVGTLGETYKVTSGSENEAITPTRPPCPRPQAAQGSSPLQALKIANRVLYVARDSQALYELAYDQRSNIYEAEELSKYADHILKSSHVVQWAFQQRPYPIVWMVLNDGTIAGLTYSRVTETIAWWTRTTEGYFESVAVLPTADEEDEVWFTVRRIINGSTVRFVERMAKFNYGTEQRDCNFVDSAYTWDGGAAVAVTGVAKASGTGRLTVTASSHGFSDGDNVRFAAIVGMTELNGNTYTVSDGTAHTFKLKNAGGTAYINGTAYHSYTSGGTVEQVENTFTIARLNGEVVAIGRDGIAHDQMTVTTNTITLSGGLYGNTVRIGLPYTSTVQCVRPQVGTTSGYIWTSTKKVSRYALLVDQSAGGQVGPDATNLADIKYDEFGETGDLYTGLTPTIPFEGGYDQSGMVYIKHEDAVPHTLLAVAFELERGE